MYDLFDMVLFTCPLAFVTWTCVSLVCSRMLDPKSWLCLQNAFLGPWTPSCGTRKYCKRVDAGCCRVLCSANNVHLRLVVCHLPTPPLRSARLAVDRAARLHVSWSRAAIAGSAAWLHPWLQILRYIQVEGRASRSDGSDSQIRTPEYRCARLLKLLLLSENDAWLHPFGDLSWSHLLPC
jgi:hypothetical protein